MEDPWNIQSLFELQYFVCPSCTYKNHSKQEFVDHAYNIHSESISQLKSITDDSISDVICPWNEIEIKEEISEQDDPFADIHQNGETLENKETATEAEPEMEEHPVEGMFCYFVGCLVSVRMEYSCT